ncbi:GntR family transcriptional regulator [Leucobacter sp. GX24907]
MAQSLRREISAGAIPPGVKLPEVAISEAMGVSRHTLRAGLQLLEEEGLARHEPNRGVFVASPSREDLLEIYRVRRVIEPGVIRTIAFETDVLDALEATARGADPTDAASLAEANQAFHRRLVEQAGSELLSRMMSRILAQMRLAYAHYEVSVYQSFRDEHFRIVELLRAGESDRAADALDAYLRDSESRAIELGVDE